MARKTADPKHVSGQPASEAVQCDGQTKGGTRCKKRGPFLEGRCPQHPPAPLEPEASPWRAESPPQKTEPEGQPDAATAKPKPSVAAPPESVLVVMTALECGPKGTFQPGTIRKVTPEHADELFRDRSAVPHREGMSRAVTPPLETRSPGQRLSGIPKDGVSKYLPE